MSMSSMMKRALALSLNSMSGSNEPEPEYVPVINNNGIIDIKELFPTVKKIKRLNNG